MDEEKEIELNKVRGRIKATIRKGRKGQLVIKTENFLLVPLAVVEILVLATVMALNYCLRYDPAVRYGSDMMNFKRVLLTCDLTKLTNKLSRPYYDYSPSSTKLMDGLELNYELPEWVFFLCALLPSILIFCITEGLRAWFPGRRYKEVETYGYVIPQVGRRIPRIIGGYLLGGSIAGIFASTMKFAMVSPRPHFMNVCFNNDLSSTDLSFCSGQSYWSPSDNCLPEVRKEDIVEALKSFPSYHATLAVYCGVFTSAYIILAAKVRGIYSGPILFILGLMVMAAIGATHRLFSGYAFPADILGGAFIGIVVAVYTVRTTMSSFRERKWKVKILDPTVGDDGISKSIDKFTSDDSDSDSGHSSEDYDRIIARIDNYPLIPRVATKVNANHHAQAVNSNVGITNDHSKNSLPRDPKSWATTSSGNPYNVPRQRYSAPLERNGPTSAGYDGPYRGDPKPRHEVLSAFEPPHHSGIETSSHF